MKTALKEALGFTLFIVSAYVVFAFMEALHG